MTTPHNQPADIAARIRAIDKALLRAETRLRDAMEQADESRADYLAVMAISRAACPDEG